MFNPKDTSNEAMLIRASAAFRLRKDGKIDFEDAIWLIVAPPADVLAASMEVAEERGPGAEARRLSALNLTDAPRKRKPRVSKAVRQMKARRRGETLDQVLARL